MNDCKHPDFTYSVVINKMARANDPNAEVVAHKAEVKITCKVCKTPFEFIGIQGGNSMIEPTVSPDGLEASFPITPSAKYLKYKKTLN